MRLDLNLASRPFVNRLPQGLLLGTLLVAAAGLTSWNVATVVRSASEAKAVEGELSRLRADEQALRARGETLQAALDDVDLAPLQLKAAAANDVLAQKALSWSLLLERLEELVPWKAALESVNASVGADGVSLTLRVRAQGQDQLLELLDALEASPCFANAYPDDEGPGPSGEFRATITVEHDPYCGRAPEIPGGKKARGAARRGGSRG